MNESNEYSNIKNIYINFYLFIYGNNSLKIKVYSTKRVKFITYHFTLNKLI